MTLTGSPTPSKKLGRGWKVAIVTVALVVVVGAAVAIGTWMNQAPGDEPVAEAPADPSSPDTSGKGELLPSEMELEIPVGLSAEQVGQTIINRIDAWNNAGGNNQQIIDDWYAYTGETGDFVAAHAQEYSTYFADALYIEGWDTPGLHPDLVNNYNAQVAINTYTLELNLITNNPENGDVEPYRLTDAFDAAREISADGDKRVIAIDFTESNNMDQNRVGEDFGTGADAAVKVPHWTYTITLVTVGGTERIAAIDLDSRQN